MTAGAFVERKWSKGESGPSRQGKCAGNSPLPRFPVVLPLISLISFNDWRAGNDCYAMTVMVVFLIDKDLNLFSPTFSFITCC